MAAIHELTDANFEAEVLQSELPCIIEFMAGWCSACKEMLPRMEAAAEHFAGKARFFVANVDESKGLRIRFAVASLPYVVLVRDGMKTPLFDELVTQTLLEERIRYVLDDGEALAFGRTSCV